MIESIALAEEMATRVASVAGFGEDDQYKIGLAVHEGVMNAFEYGNQQRRDQREGRSLPDPAQDPAAPCGSRMAW